MTIWDMLAECLQRLDEPFRRNEIVGWFRRHHPEVNESSLAAHIQSATAGVPNRGAFASRQPLLDRLDHGLYQRFRPPATATTSRPPASARSAPVTPRVSAPASVVLVGCAETKLSAAAPAAELYVSPLFRRRREYAQRSGRPWFVLSAEHGLVHPAAVLEPYDRRLSDQTAAYRQAWGEWVAAKLEDALGTLAGVTIEIHAGEAYVEAVRLPLERRGPSVRTPLAGLRQGEQLAWYDTGHRTPPASGEGAAPEQADGSEVDELVRRLTDPSGALTPPDLAGARSAPSARALQLVGRHRGR